MLEDPSLPAPDDMWTRTDDPRTAPDQPIDISICFEKGLPVKLTFDGQVLEHQHAQTSLQKQTTSQKSSSRTFTDGLDIFIALNAIGKTAGIGRIDIVENRFIGLKR